MRNILISSSLILIVCLAGCQQQPTDPRINLQPGVKSDSLSSNIITRPIGNTISAIFGEGIEVSEVRTYRNNAGFMEVQMAGYNKSTRKKDFQYKIDWIDAQGKYINSVTTSWARVSAMPKSTFRIQGVAPRKEAVDFRINTRKK